MEDAFREELTRLINKHSLENKSNTPDFVIADFLIRCLSAHTVATNHRSRLIDPQASKQQENDPS